MTEYTAAQREAIHCVDETLQIIACAGSGKTQVISQRVADILLMDGVAPANVVAFTFTEKAAAELKDRVLGIVQEQHGSTTGLADMFIGTMHAFCLNLLQTYVPEAFKFSVLTEITQRLLIDRNSSLSGLTECPTTSANTPTLRRYIHSGLYARVLSVLSEDVIDFPQVPQGVVASQYKYKTLLAKNAHFDYTTMLEVAVDLLESDEEDPDAAALLRHVRQDVRYVVADEYQDVNPLQERLIRALVRFGANLCVVGDDDQTIYQWRGSEVSNIVRFAERYDDVRQVTLAENFRSSQGVVAVGKAVAESIPAGHRLPKEMQYASHQDWTRGDILMLPFVSPEDEAGWICSRIEDLRGVAFRDAPGAASRGLSWSDMAVLFRSVAKDAGPLVAEMDRRKIPYVVKGLTRLFDAPAIQAVEAMFQYLVGDIGRLVLESLWDAAEIVPRGTSLDPLLRVLDQGGDFTRGERWGVYNIQRVYLDALDAMGVREGTIPGDAVRGELVFYELGKFSQVISDFEAIHFQSAPERKYRSFVEWLRNHARDYYDDADSDVGYATPDAVTISTVHQAKGMQWPAVFVPCLRKNRFPSQRHGGLNLFHVIPDTAVADADRYKGTNEDERRLFYVAVTRAQKYLYMSFSPSASSRYKAPSEFVSDVIAVGRVSTADGGLPPDIPRLAPHARSETPQVTLSFSELKYLFECPYEFKLRFMYGFNPPLHEALGYGKGLHDALAEIHKRALLGDIPVADEIAALVDRHLFTPYAYPALREQLVVAARAALARYMDRYGADIERTVHSEKQIQVHIAPGITVDGRIDLVTRLDTDEVSIIDFKSTDQAQEKAVTWDQLHVYALGYQELTGDGVDVVEVRNLDEKGKSERDEVRGATLDHVRNRIKAAGEAIRTNDLPAHVEWQHACDRCDLVGLCRPRP